MARFVFGPSRLNSTVTQKGKEYNLRLMQRAQTVFTNLLNLLPSNYISAVQGPNYTQALKAVAVEIARLELALEDVDRDRDFSTTRSDFLWSIVGYLALVNGRLPDLGFSDEEFRNFFLNLIRIYFQGSVPDSMRDVVDLFIDGNIEVTEAFLLLRQGASGLDISDEFVFSIDYIVPPGGGFPPDIFEADSSIRQILDLVRPAHTLFRIRYIFSDEYIPGGEGINEIIDAMRWKMSVYYYADFRSYWQGIRDRDRLGKKKNKCVVAEDHSNDF
jgi:hypothetical protein